jgi:hypothetical protein
MPESVKYHEEKQTYTFVLDGIEMELSKSRFEKEYIKIDSFNPATKLVIKAAALKQQARKKEIEREEDRFVEV